MGSSGSLRSGDNERYGLSQLSKRAKDICTVWENVPLPERYLAAKIEIHLHFRVITSETQQFCLVFERPRCSHACHSNRVRGANPEVNRVGNHQRKFPVLVDSVKLVQDPQSVLMDLTAVCTKRLQVLDACSHSGIQRAQHFTPLPIEAIFVSKDGETEISGGRGGSCRLLHTARR